MDETTKPVIPSSDRAVFLARLLQRRNIPLGVPWLDALPCLSVRVYNVLTRAGLETLGDVLQAMRDEGGDTPLGKNTPRHVFDELWEAFEVLAGPAVTSYHPTLAESAETIFWDDQSESQWIKQPLSEYTLARMEASGVNADAPWQDALPVVSARLREALNRFSTLREVVVAATDKVESFRETPNFGRRTLRELWVLFERLAEHGADYGPCNNSGSPPATIDELVAWAWQSVAAKDAQLLRRRYLDGTTLEQLGREQGVSGNAIQLRIHRILKLTRARSLTAAQELMGPLLTAMEASGGLVHRNMARDLTGTDDLCRICMAALFANADLRIWREEFLTMLGPGELARRLSAVRGRLRENRHSAMSLAIAGDLVAASSGFRLDPDGLCRLLSSQLNCHITDGVVVIAGGPK
ncbi:MAG: hypothetical protein ACKVX9_07125 [Blastocatellia bacterium]